MNIEQIKQIVNSSVKDDVKEALIIRVLALDKKVIPDILNVLYGEREQKERLITDMNVEISRYNIHINNKTLLKENKDFLNKETKKLYQTWIKWIVPLFNNQFK
jgi:hypothetical protein